LRINSFSRVFVADSAVVGQLGTIASVHLTADDVEGIVNYVRNGTNVGCVETHANGGLEVDVHLPVNDLSGLHNIIAARAASHVEVRNLEHLVLKDSEPPKVLWVLEAVDGQLSCGLARADQVLSLRLSSIGLHVLVEDKPDFGGHVRGSLDSLVSYIDVAMNFDLADFNLPSNPVIKRSSHSGRAEGLRITDRGRAKVHSARGVHLGVLPIGGDGNDGGRIFERVHVLHLRVDLPSTGAGNTSFGQEVFLARLNPASAHSLACLRISWVSSSC